MAAICVAAGCSPPPETPTTIVGTIQNHKIDEASGLARSQRHDNVFWVANDDGPSVLYAIDSTGKDLGRVKIKDASNRDWEDLASFTLDGVPYLVAADIGDNDADRKDVRLYVIEEPEAGDDKVDYAWRIEFSYAEGPRDAEAVAVDVENERVLVMTKRDVPASLYSVPLKPDSDKRQTAVRLGFVASLPQPTRSDVKFTPKTDAAFWRPTSMDIANDGSSAVVLTYGGVFLYPRASGQDWLDAFQRQPRVISRSGNRQAESVAFNDAGDAVYITLEQRNAPLFRLPTQTSPGDSP
ncbi:MAG: hypothetical protein P8X81_07230 [Woeseiaceae bacterium]